MDPKEKAKAFFDSYQSQYLSKFPRTLPKRVKFYLIFNCIIFIKINFLILNRVFLVELLLHLFQLLLFLVFGKLFLLFQLKFYSNRLVLEIKQLMNIKDIKRKQIK